MHAVRLISVVLTAGCLLAGCRSDQSAAPVLQTEPETEVTVTETTVPRICNLVTLGDSISAGYGLERPETQRYSALLTQKLAAASGVSWNDYNYAVSGDDSSDLIGLLREGTAEKLESADLICLYIGANNLLGPYTDYLQKATSVFHMPESGSGAAGWLGKIAGALDNGINGFTQIQEKVEDGMSRLAADLPAVYEHIRNENPDAPLCLMNVYNPYAHVTFGNPVTKETFGEYAGQRIDRVNEILRSFAASHPDIIPVNIYEVFAACENVPILGNLNEGISKEQKVNVDPHPNKEGQELIADAIFEKVGSVR